MTMKRNEKIEIYCPTCMQYKNSPHMHQFPIPKERPDDKASLKSLINLDSDGAYRIN